MNTLHSGHLSWNAAPHFSICRQLAERSVPRTFSKRMFIQPDSEFNWPRVRKISGGFHNLRTMPNVRFGHYTAHLLDPKLDTAFVAVCNPRLRLLVLYLFRREDFPWVGNWEERRNRISAPWNGREFCRAFEFSSTPFPIPRRETVTRGNLFGEMTYRWLPAKSEADCQVPNSHA